MRVRALEEKADVDVAGLFGADRFVRAASLSALLVSLAPRGHDPVRFERVDLRARPDILSAIMKPPGPFFEPGDGSPPRGAYRAEPEQYLNVLEGLPVFEATGRLDFEAAVRFSVNLLQTSGSTV